jgi:hypothetical protein
MSDRNSDMEGMIYVVDNKFIAWIALALCALAEAVAALGTLVGPQSV